MALIEFLLKNWYIVVILLALFSQFGKIAARRTNSEGNGKNGMPTFGGNPGMPGRMGGSPLNRPAKQERVDFPGDPHTADRDRKSSGSGFDSPQTTSKGSPLNNERTLIDTGAAALASKESPFLEGKELAGSPFSNAGTAHRQADYMNETYENADKAASTALQTSREQLAQGIIWAEILGPPRAKKPYPYRR